MKRNGFTIIELVVVIAIVVLLAVALAPVFLKPREPARPATCQSNLKLIALGFKQYVQDFDQKLPISKNSRSGFDHSDNWAGQLQPYLKSHQILQCPSDDSAIDPKKSSYAYNAWLDQRSEEKITESAVVILNFEVRADPNNWTQTGTGPQAVSASTRHLEGSNFSFVDGHVKWFKPGKVGAFRPQSGQPTFMPG